MTSASSESGSDGPKSRHHLLRPKLTLDEGTSSDKAAAEVEVEKKESKKESKKKASKKHLSSKDTSDKTN